MLTQPTLAQLHALDLGGNLGLADRAVRTLATSPAAGGLRSLVLSETAVTWRGLQDLLTLVPVPRPAAG